MGSNKKIPFERLDKSCFEENVPSIILAFKLFQNALLLLPEKEEKYLIHFN